MPRFAASLVLAAVVTSSVACSHTEETKLTISVLLPLAGTKTVGLQCDPPGGTVPNPRRSCAILEKHGEAMLTPVEVTGICAGGSVSAYLRARGTYRGEQVDVATSTCDSPNQGARFWVDAAGGDETVKAIVCASRLIPAAAKSSLIPSSAKSKSCEPQR